MTDHSAIRIDRLSGREFEVADLPGIEQQLAEEGDAVTCASISRQPHRPAGSRQLAFGMPAQDGAAFVVVIYWGAAPLRPRRRRQRPDWMLLGGGHQM
ncbi:hypothetical protein [Nocardia barduliensis]|uniref:hypothetical protein n=1 Tax=Nocardia barduliensis TaxID=2736643 RepID=UPI0015723846|nr:hypothetical protein [Nocardia barduliensis]